ncbi:efflux transporter outer membrane subunit [Pedosphaera parvula]|uniref:RND efflux system, outer membrane lipoprotein, NodT family n=1 Tax=Pedosphaera parvula (strain Ellin514) TaxID=320771 RepID=B9XRM5_PEDPL|nr:efflux transporter outer membrane subunit [Pedosphaera parvula]EEF57496.1 RND efflux system, outer membrane lipoprotein, NodT family [Pedosphaera parvula Ellin514]
MNARIDSSRGERKCLDGRFQILVSLLMVTLWWSGCNFAPKYNRPSVQTPAAFKEMEGWARAQPKDHEIRGKWWEVFNDPELNALEEQVTISNQNVAAAVANFAAARAIVRQARSQYFPTATMGPSVTRSKTSATGTTSFASSFSTNGSSGRAFTLYALPFDATWDPDFWGGIRNTVKADIAAAQSSAAILENVKLTNQVAMAAVYFELRGQDALKEILDSAVVSFQKTLDLTKALFTTGINSDVNVALAETQLQTTVAQATSLGVQRAQFEHAIALLIGKPASTFSVPARPLKASPPAIPVGVPSQLLERRPDIAAAERIVAQANAQIGVARAAYFPTITLTASSGFQSVTTANLLTGPSAVWSIGAAMAETLFDAGRRAAVTQQAWATYNLTVADYRQTVLTAFVNVEDNLAALRILSQQLQQQEVAVKSAERSLALTIYGYKTGINSYLNVLTAQTALLNNQETAMTIRIQQMTASVQLINALGGGWKVSELPSAGQATKKTAPAP